MQNPTCVATKQTTDEDNHDDSNDELNMTKWEPPNDENNKKKKQSLKMNEQLLHIHRVRAGKRQSCRES